MKFTSSIEIDRSIGPLVELFQDPDVTLKWLEGLRSVEHVSGEYRQPGAVSKVVFDSAAGRMLITETVIQNNLPDEYIIRYEGQGYVSFSNYCFEELMPGRTKLTMVQHVELKGALKLASGLIKGTLSRQLQKSVESFKRYAEAQK